MEEKVQQIIDNSEYTDFVGVRFINGNRAYYFGVNDIDLKIDDKVVVDTARGMELGIVTNEPVNINKYKSELGLKPVLRKATDIDVRAYESNVKDAKFALEICAAEVQRLGLNMNLISCEYTLDKTRVLFSYLADDRVDFRELLKVLASKLHTRIELRQVGSRDKAKMVGGIGICGLPLCCSTFLNEFDGISINRAKNQMLAINIPKLSGQCGKLICCLKYEDEAYTEDKKTFPELGTKVWLDKVEFTVTNINIVSKVIRIESEEDIKYYSLEDYNKEFRKIVVKDKKDFKENRNNNQQTQNNGKDKTNNQNQNRESKDNQNPNQNKQQNNNNQNRNNHNRNHHHHNNQNGQNNGRMNNQNPNQNKQGNKKERPQNNEKK